MIFVVLENFYDEQEQHLPVDLLYDYDTYESI